MGDRILFQVTDGEDVSPVVYGHWSGSAAWEICATLKSLMKDRPRDVSYTAARLVGIIHERIDGNLSLGMWNRDMLLDDAASHGDEGCVVVDFSGSNMRFRCFGGYLTIGTDGLPCAAE